VSLSVLIFFETIATFVIWKMYHEKSTLIFERKIDVFHDVYISTRHTYAKVSKLLYDQIINTPEVIALFKYASSEDPRIQESVREKLYTKLLPVYRSLQSINLKQLHFHRSDMRSFLRFHRVEKYGDSLEGIRPSLVLANRDKKYVEGFEEGRAYNGFRYVYPLFDEEKRYLGTVETSLSFNALRSDIEHTLETDVDFVIKRDIVARKVWKEEQSNYTVSEISDRYLHEKEPESKRSKFYEINLAIKEEASKMMLQNRTFALCKNGYIIVFLPITNIAGEEGAAYLINYLESTVIRKTRDEAYFMWLISTLGVLSIVTLLYLLLQKMRRINEIASYDALTGLYNRHSFTEVIQYETERVKRTERAYSLIYLDIDNFKRINDSYGHETGDSVLKQLADILKRRTRKTDIVGRWGGEEFLISLPETTPAHAVLLAEKLRREIAQTDFGISLPVTCSFGVTTYRIPELLDVMIARADQNLYQAKEEGKNRVISS
ncbi:MAG: diguanylate cyclase, partial [Sulfurovum sp.]